MSNVKMIDYEFEVKAWVKFNIPPEEVLMANVDEAPENVFNVDKAIENGLDIWDYWDDEAWNGLDISRCDATGETWQDDLYNEDELAELLSDEDIMGDSVLVGKIIDLIKQHQST